MKGLYPFHDGRYEDFARVFDHLIKVPILSIFPIWDRFIFNF